MFKNIAKETRDGIWLYLYILIAQLKLRSLCTDYVLSDVCFVSSFISSLFLTIILDLKWIIFKLSHWVNELVNLLPINPVGCNAICLSYTWSQRCWCFTGLISSLATTLKICQFFVVVLFVHFLHLKIVLKK